MNSENPKSAPGTLDIWVTTAIWCALMACALFIRPLLPIDETRYITVAWEMWNNHDYWVPTLNGEIYSHKPPFLFWFMDLAWSLFGVSEISARLIAPLFGLGALVITSKLARELWSDAPCETQTLRARMAPLMMVTGVYWAIFSTMTMFDMLVTFAAVVAIWGYVKAWKGFVTGQGFWRGMIIAGIGIGIGGLAKGPAILVHTLPVALFVPYWGPYMPQGRGGNAWRTWYIGVLISVLIGLALTLAWAIPAALIGGPEYRDAIFIKQSADRMVKSFAHRRPFYWFAMVMPALLLPWTLWPKLWKQIGFRKAWQDRTGLRASLHLGSVRMLLIWSGASFVIFSAISGKQPHYLLPIFPALALLSAYFLSHEDQTKETQPDKAQPSARAHKVPVLVLAVLSFVLYVGLQVKHLIEPLLKRPIPDWVDLIQPLWLLVGVAILGFIAFKRAHRADSQVRLIALASTSFLVFVYVAFAPALNVAYNLEPSAVQVKAYQDASRPVAYVGKYHGEFQFLGRLTQPLVPLKNIKEANVWAKDNPNGVVIDALRPQHVPPSPKPEHIFPYRGKVLVMWNAAHFFIPQQ